MNKHAQILQSLGEKGLTLGSAESLTAGLFASKVCEIPGASEVFKGAIVAYDPAVKQSILKVRKETIETNGVVSHQVASEMAVGGARALGVDICVSCTGNAGPTAQEGEAKVGDVYLGLYFQGNVWTIPLALEGDRDQIRKAAAEAMFTFVASLLR